MIQEATMAKNNHELGCKCQRCYSLVLGEWLDSLGGLTAAGAWGTFLTVTFRAQSDGAFGQKATSGFGNSCFQNFVTELSGQLGSRVEYVLADQRGERHGRFHQHALVAAHGLSAYPRRELENWFRLRAGWCRALPFQQGAAYYVARYIGRHLETADWKVEVGDCRRHSTSIEVGRTVVVTSAAVPSALFHQTYKGRKR
jgi:hypothetical protein